MSEAKYDIIIVGGGVIGNACAYELGSRGAKILLLEKGEIGFGCSYGNAGWLTPCFAMPLPMPGQFFKALGWLMDPDSPLYIKPSLDPLVLKWLGRFTLSMNHDLMKKSVAALTELSKFSLHAYEDLARKFPQIQMQKRGLLMATKSQAGIESAIEEMELVAVHGIPGKQLTESELKELEPALQGNFLGGVYFPEEAHAEPLQVVKAFKAGAESFGVEFRSNIEVTDFAVNDQNITEVITNSGKFRAKQVLLATGSWSTAIGKSLKLNIPVLGGKGYALILPPLDPMPKIPLMLVEKKIAITPRAESIRIAGTLELVNQDFEITQRRVNAILNGAREFLKIPENPQIQETWRGLRPCTPDGVPVIGRSPKIKNLIIATGHQMLGLQSAPGTARLAADIALDAKASFELYPFRAERF